MVQAGPPRRLRWAIADCSKANPHSSLMLARCDERALRLPSQDVPGHRGGTRALPAPCRLLSSNLAPGLGPTRTGGGLAAAQAPGPFPGTS